ncbi:MAG TPA: hypothetical protein VI731_07930 [Bacteroidia bacterium]|nr:hypothetical protein [Bacteroidia bacterium]
MNYIRISAFLIILFLGLGCGSDKFESFYPDGRLKTVVTLDEAGKKNGIQEDFWPNGKIKGVYEWKHGVAHGVYREFYENGQKSIEARFDNGNQSDVLYEYYKNGKIKSESQYLKGKNNGYFRSYDESGNLGMIAKTKNDSTLSFIKIKSDSTITEMHMYAGLINIPDTLTYVPNSKVMITLTDSATIGYFTSKISLYNNNKSYENEKPTYSFAGKRIKNGFTFDVPIEVKPGKYILNIAITPLKESSVRGVSVVHRVVKGFSVVHRVVIKE